MLSLTAVETVFFILLFHWLADFVAQTDWQAKNKSHNNWALLAHVETYSVITTLSWVYFLDRNICMWKVFFITLACHFATDYITSRINTCLYQKGRIHYFFVSIGFDQLLHFIQLLLTFYLLQTN